MRILFLNQAFWPDVVATAQHAHDLAAHLAARGHEVTAVASRSLYGSRGATLPREETVDGVRVLRIGRSLFGKAGILARMADFALFYAAATLQLLRLPRQDVVVCLTTPPLIVMAALLARRLKGGRVAYWLMDLYPELPIVCGYFGARHPLARIASAMDRRCVRSADAVVVLGRCMRERVLAKGADPKRVRIIGVWSDEEELQAQPCEPNPFREEWGARDRTVVMYSGNFGIGHDVETMLGAAERLRDDPSILFAFVGGGKRREEVERFVRERGLVNCVLAPYQPRSALGPLLRAGDIHLVTMRQGLDGLMVPSKFYGIMGASRPAIFVGPEGSEVAACIREEGCGEVVPLGDVDGLAAAIRRLAADPARRRELGERGHAALVRSHSRGVRVAEWEELLTSLAPDASSGSR